MPVPVPVPSQEPGSTLRPSPALQPNTSLISDQPPKSRPASEKPTSRGKVARNRWPAEPEEGRNRWPVYLTLQETKENAEKFPNWTKSPSKFWEISIAPLAARTEGKDLTTWRETEGKDETTRRKELLEHAVKRKDAKNAINLQHSFMSAIVYKFFESFRRVFRRDFRRDKTGQLRITFQAIDSFLRAYDISEKLRLEYRQLIIGGRRRIEFLRDLQQMDKKDKKDGKDDDLGPLFLPLESQLYDVKCPLFYR